MNQELNGQICQLCNKNPARNEKYCGVLYICQKCARLKMINEESQRESDKIFNSLGACDD